MRTIPGLTTGLALVALLPAVAAAQDDARPFTDAWFWGAKSGVMTVRTPAESEMAPLAGAEWLITRSRAGLYLSVEQGFFDDVVGSVPDPSANEGARQVVLNNFRRASFALVAFPGRFETVRPYAGIGWSVNLVQRATPVGAFASPQDAQQVMERIEDRRSRSSFVFMGGVQGQVLGNVALFAQATSMPTGGRFLLNGDENIYMLEAGLRWNVGSAIERLDR